MAPKIHPNGSQNPPKLVPNSSLGGVLGGSCCKLFFVPFFPPFFPPLGGILERTWAPSWPQVEPSWEQVGPSWGQDAPCWRQVGPSWRQSCPSWRQNGTNMGFHTDCFPFSRGLQICIDLSSDAGPIFDHVLIPRNLTVTVFA